MADPLTYTVTVPPCQTLGVTGQARTDLKEGKPASHVYVTARWRIMQWAILLQFDQYSSGLTSVELSEVRRADLPLPLMQGFARGRVYSGAKTPENNRVWALDIDAVDFEAVAEDIMAHTLLDPFDRVLAAREIEFALQDWLKTMFQELGDSEPPADQVKYFSQETMHPIAARLEAHLNEALAPYWASSTRLALELCDEDVIAQQLNQERRRHG